MSSLELSLLLIVQCLWFEEGSAGLEQCCGMMLHDKSWVRSVALKSEWHVSLMLDSKPRRPSVKCTC